MGRKLTLNPGGEEPQLTMLRKENFIKATQESDIALKIKDRKTLNKD